VPRAPARASEYRVAVIGSGPAGLAAAQQLRRFGHTTVVFEKNERAGGLLRYGIPDFKLEKSVLDLRLAQLEAEGVVFRSGIDVGIDISADELRDEFDAICIATGAGVPRDLDVPGRKLGGVQLAMDFLTAQNRRNQAEDFSDGGEARGKNVVIIGGGDTGSDCAGTCIRQGARSVQQFELMPQPSVDRSPSTPWPLWPMQLRTSHAHEEGCDREWSVATTRFSGEQGNVQRLHAARVQREVLLDGRMQFTEIPGSAFEVEADLVLLAMGFAGAERSRLLSDLQVELDAKGNIKSDVAHRTSVPGVFAAGDANRGASLIVWAIREGRDAADSIHQWLTTNAHVPQAAASSHHPLYTNTLR
jgi:glutamate synthase (NADPH/NADH) small chain